MIDANGARRIQRRHAQRFVQRDADMLDAVLHRFDHGQRGTRSGAVLIHAQPIPMVYCFTGENKLVNICTRRCGSRR